MWADRWDRLVRFDRGDQDLGYDPVVAHLEDEDLFACHADLTARGRVRTEKTDRYDNFLPVEPVDWDPKGCARADERTPSLGSLDNRWTVDSVAGVGGGSKVKTVVGWKLGCGCCARESSVQIVTRVTYLSGKVWLPERT